MSDVENGSITDPVVTPGSTSITTAQCQPVHSSPTLASSHVMPSSSSAGNPRSSHLRFPVRIGISWMKGEKLEAMDFSRTWYPSKIVDIDEEQKAVLIHFEGWNQRYDEWLSMDSDKLRPVTRHSERKDKCPKKRRIHPHPIYRAGEQVLAKWIDCKKYPAKISRMLEDGSYEVTFYDGVSCQIQAMNIQPLPEDMKNLKLMPPIKSPPNLKPKLSFKNIKVSLPESVTKRVEQHAAEKKKQEQLAMLSKKPEQILPEKKKESTLTVENKKVEHQAVTKTKLDPHKSLDLAANISDSGNEVQTACVTNKGSVSNEQNETPECGQRIADQVLQDNMKATVTKSSAKRKRSSPKVLIRRESNMNTYSVYLTNTPAAKRKKVEQKSLSLAPVMSSPKPESFASKEDTGTPIISTEDSNASPSETQVIESVHVATQSMVQSGDSMLETMMVPQTVNSAVTTQIILTKRPGRPGRSGRKRMKKRFSRIKVSSKKIGLKTGQDPNDALMNVKKKSPLCRKPRRKFVHSTFVNVLVPGTVNSSGGIPIVETFVPSKAFIVEEDHNPFKCSYKGCTKAFRKETLLQSHIKYYHMDPEVPSTSNALSSPLGQSPLSVPGARRRRKKNNSICSTDSDISIGSKEKLLLNKRQRHDSELSITTTSPDFLSKDLWADMKPQHSSQDRAHDDVNVETEDDFETDIVNCVCGQRETNGLMIQCDICMCWQHFACMDTSKTGEPPANYVCFICENTPGIRESCKYMYDLSWEKKGDLPTFPFVSETPSESLRLLAVECQEISSTLYKIKSALHSSRRQIKISKEEDDPEFQLWQMDWDNWTKPEEDLTLTPRSADPDPSPTPSTYLFPSAPSTTCHPASTVNTSSASISSAATIEVTTGIPSPLHPPCSHECDAKVAETGPKQTISPPPSPFVNYPQTPSVLRSAGHHCASDDLVRDLFPGPGGDAGNCKNPTVSQWKTSTLNSPSVKMNGDELSSEGNKVSSEKTLDSSGIVDNELNKNQAANADMDIVSGSLDQANVSADVSNTPGNQVDRDDLPMKPLSELFVDVNGVQSHSTVFTDDQDNDTDTAEESVDPYKNCEHNLLVHVTRVHDNIEKHLETIEQQIKVLEDAEHSNPTVQLTDENILNDVPALKKSLAKLSRNLHKVQRLCHFN